MPETILSVPAYETGVHAAYDTLRSSSPVQRALAPGGLPVWIITGYREAIAAFKDPRLAKDPRRLTEAEHGFAGQRYPEDAYALSDKQLLNTDGDEHTELRRLVAPYLSRRSVEQLDPFVEATCTRLLNELARDDIADLFTGYARMVPATVMGRIIGMPEHTLPDLVDDIVTMLQPDPPTDPHIAQAHRSVAACVEDHVQRKTHAPDGDDLTSALIRACDAGTITEHQVTTMIKMIVGAGVVTTATLIAHGALALLPHPGRDEPQDPGHIAPFIEELLRLEAPLTSATWRFATEPLQIGEQTIAAGDVVLISLLSANRDPSTYRCPADINPARQEPPHLAFGHGSHFCLGARLARMEAEIALRALLHHQPRPHLLCTPDQLTWHGGLIVRDLDKLPVNWSDL